MAAEPPVTPQPKPRSPRATRLATEQARSSASHAAGASETALGLARGKVRVVDHDPNWSFLFIAEKERILQVVGSAALDIQHVGSTAVPGLPAKPIIDIAVAVESLAVLPDFIESLSRLEYVYLPEIIIPGEAFFRKEGGTYHLHLLSRTSREWRNYILFRNYLREHPETATDYVALKNRLAEQFAEDRDSYTRGKADFIRSVLHHAQHR